MARAYVVATATGHADVRNAAGSSSLWIVIGRLYLADDAFVRGNPSMFRPAERSELPEAERRAAA